MSSITRRNGKYQAQVRRLGQSISRTFHRKSDAVAWARQVESDIERGTFADGSAARRTTLREAIRLYRKQVLPGLATTSQVIDVYRLNALESKLGSLSLAAVTTEAVSNYRNARLKLVGPATVLKELGTLSRVLTACRTEWGLPVANVVKEIRKPTAPPGRARRLKEGELDRLLKELLPVMQALVLFAIETAMRRGEIVSMRFEHVDWDRRTLRIPKTKTGIARTIPLSQRAYRVLESLRDGRSDGRVFRMTAATISQAFRRACQRAGLEDLHLHDLRHEATSRLFEKGLAVMEVASITGHADLRMLARYTHLRADDLVCKVG